MFRWCFLVCILLIAEADSSDEIRKECRGRERGLGTTAMTPDKRYEEYRMMYENCTIIRTNLEIVFMDVPGARYDFSFLETIREVHGYVLIVGNYVDRIRLNGLRVIRGWKTYDTFVTSIGKSLKCSLIVVANEKHDNSTGLKELQMTSLVEITNGDVYFEFNSHLCFGEWTINWKYIKQNNSGEIVIVPPRKKFGCGGKCHKNCTIGSRKFCWGKGPDMCQAQRPCGNCSRGCLNCTCHSECIGGCTGSYESSCVACKHFLKGDRCVKKCNEGKYNESTTILYEHRGKCVAACPENMFVQNTSCVFNCIAGYMENKTSNDGKCIPCKDGICPKTCNGTKHWLHGNNLAEFIQCTKVEGNLIIKDATFFGSVEPKINVTDLEILSDIDEITGFLQVDTSHPNLTSLSFLRNLRVVRGNDERKFSITVSGTHLRELNLKSLRQIKTRGVGIAWNHELCYVNAINWTRILTNRVSEQPVYILDNANSSTCEERGLICSELCSDFGCWGPGNDNCLSCRYYSMMGSCVANCTTHGLCAFTAEDGTPECRKCPRKCPSKCSGSHSSPLKNGGQ